MKRCNNGRPQLCNDVIDQRVPCTAWHLALFVIARPQFSNDVIYQRMVFNK